tara:strand:- start:1844 stop:2332 length:489 start_codon:yes stop_codon:yes gene_type:complete
MIRKWIEKAVDRYLVSHDNLAANIVSQMHIANEYYHLAEAFNKAELMKAVDLEDLACKIDMYDLAGQFDEDSLAVQVIDSLSLDEDDIARKILNEIDTGDIAVEIDLDDLAGYFDTSDIASYIDTYDVANNIDTDEIAESIVDNHFDAILEALKEAKEGEEE